MEEKLEQIIDCFLLINPSPSDAQYHAFAEALGVDKETLEAILYRMHGEVVQEEEGGINSIQRLSALSDDQLVIQDDYDPAVTPDEQIVLNDSYTDPSISTDVQELLYDDGVEDDNNLDDVLTNDGEPEV